MTDKPSPPPPPAWVALADDFMAMANNYQGSPPPERVLALIQKHALPASSSREERLAALVRNRQNGIHEYTHSHEGTWVDCPERGCVEARKALEER